VLPAIAQAIAGARRFVHVTGWHVAPHFELERAEPPIVVGALLAEVAERVDVRVLVWAGALVPAFHPTRGEVADAVQTLTRATRIRCETDPREHPFHCHRRHRDERRVRGRRSARATRVRLWAGSTSSSTRPVSPRPTRARSSTSGGSGSRTSSSTAATPAPPPRTARAPRRLAPLTPPRTPPGPARRRIDRTSRERQPVNVASGCPTSTMEVESIRPVSGPTARTCRSKNACGSPPMRRAGSGAGWARNAQCQ
jgi:hypothetical protein